MEIFFWFIGMVLICLPIVLGLFSIFLMLTYRVSEEEIFEDGSWLDDVDEKSKN